MTHRVDLLDGALHQLREASNPSAGERARILAAVQRLGSNTTASAAEGAPAPVPAPTRVPGPAPWKSTEELVAGRVEPSSLLTRKSLAWGLALGLAAFGVGMGIGVGVGIDLGRGSVEPPPEHPLASSPAVPSVPAPSLAVPESPLAQGAEHEARNRASRSDESRASASRAGSATAEAAAPSPAPASAAARRQLEQRAKARARARPLATSAKSPLTLAEALQLVHRAERAIYSDNAAWALTLLDDLDERAPRAMLHEERLATRILALCADGQVESAERLASRARQEAPSSIYGSILERVCDSAASSAPASKDSTRP